MSNRRSASASKRGTARRSGQSSEVNEGWRLQQIARIERMHVKRQGQGEGRRATKQTPAGRQWKTRTEEHCSNASSRKRHWGKVTSAGDNRKAEAVANSTDLVKARSPKDKGRGRKRKVRWEQEGRKRRGLQDVCCHTTPPWQGASPRCIPQGG